MELYCRGLRVFLSLERPLVARNILQEPVADTQKHGVFLIVF